jgi:hypothetical protein
MALDDKSTYYDAGGIEVFKIIKAKLTEEQYIGFLLGNVLKYSCRANFKQSSLHRDMEKTQHYLKLLNETLNTMSNFKKSNAQFAKELKQQGESK